jgi:hypothetical protein
MIDIHVLLHHSNAEWDTQNHSTIDRAINLAPFPVVLHRLPGENGHIGRGRARGYALGTQPYVTYVDHDDYLLPDALAALWPALQQAPDAIFPWELVVQNGFVSVGQKMHHLCVYKREHIIDHAKYVACGDLAQVYVLVGKRCIELEHRGYVHRVYNSEGKALRNRNIQEYVEVTKHLR